MPRPANSAPHGASGPAGATPSSLAALQAAFAHAILADSPAGGTELGSIGLTAHSGEAALPTRFRTYRRTVRAGIIGVLEARYRVVARLVGEEFFRAMALLFVQQAPPASPVLIEYGGGFPDFVASFPPAADVPYLADVARLELLQHDAFHAADAAPLDAAALAAIPAEAIASARFRLHPSARLLRSPYPVLAIWQTNTRDAQVQPVDMDAGGDALLIVRPALEVMIRRLPPAAFALIAAMAADATLETAVAAAVAADPHADVQRLLSNVITAGCLSGYTAG